MSVKQNHGNQALDTVRLSLTYILEGAAHELDHRKRRGNDVLRHCVLPEPALRVRQANIQDDRGLSRNEQVRLG